MITKTLDDNTISFIAEDSDDLLTIRRLIKSGDKIIGETTRVIKQEKEYSRPDKGERIKIRLAIEVEKISLDDVLDRIRVGGIITESNNDAVPHGSHHSFIIKIEQPFNLEKKKWTSVERKLARAKDHGETFLLVAIDTGDCGVGRLKGTHLHLLPNMYSGSSGKRYKSNFKIEKFFDDVTKALSAIIQKDDILLIFGPGETRKKFGNFLSKTSLGQKIQIKVIEGIDSGGEDGIHIFTKSESMKEIMSDTHLLCFLIKQNRLVPASSSVFLGFLSQLIVSKCRFKPEKNTLLVWPSQFTHVHRGNPPLSNDKYIITGWVEYGY